jgi:hypothetical protein
MIEDDIASKKKKISYRGRKKSEEKNREIEVPVTVIKIAKTK